MMIIITILTSLFLSSLRSSSFFPFFAVSKDSAERHTHWARTEINLTFFEERIKKHLKLQEEISEIKSSYQVRSKSF